MDQMTADEIAQRLIGRTVTGACLKGEYDSDRAYDRLEWLDLDDGSRLSFDLERDDMTDEPLIELSAPLPQA